MKALILCAGRGTRLGLKRTPKCMVKVNKKPVLEHLVNHLNKHGITDIMVNVHRDYQKIFKYFGTRLAYTYEDIPLGEARTEQLLQGWLGEEYIVMNGDTLTDLNIRELTTLGHSVVFAKDGKYAGTKYIKRGTTPTLWDGGDAHCLDIGTPKGLRIARRHYRKG